MEGKLATVLNDQVGRLAVEHEACVNALSFASGHEGEPQARANERAAYQRLIDAAIARDAVMELVDAAAYAMRTRDDSGNLSDTGEYNLRAALVPFGGA